MSINGIAIMNFMEALAECVKGELIGRNAWSSNKYVFSLPTVSTLYVTVSGDTLSQWAPSMADILADDWKVIPR